MVGDAAQGTLCQRGAVCTADWATDEDDGYLVSVITYENSGTSECILIDCKDFAAGPVCRITLPNKISSGTHAHWTDRPVLRASAI